MSNVLRQKMLNRQTTPCCSLGKICGAAMSPLMLDGSLNPATYGGDLSMAPVPSASAEPALTAGFFRRRSLFDRLFDDFDFPVFPFPKFPRMRSIEIPVDVENVWEGTSNDDLFDKSVIHTTVNDKRGMKVQFDGVEIYVPPGCSMDLVTKAGVNAVSTPVDVGDEIVEYPGKVVVKRSSKRKPVQFAVRIKSKDGKSSFVYRMDQDGRTSSKCVSNYSRSQVLTHVDPDEEEVDSTVTKSSKRKKAKSEKAEKVEKALAKEDEAGEKSTSSEHDEKEVSAVEARPKKSEKKKSIKRSHSRREAEKSEIETSASASE